MSRNNGNDVINSMSVIESINLMDEAHMNITNLIDRLDSRDDNTNLAITAIDRMEGLLGHFSNRQNEIQQEMSTLLQSSKYGALSHEQLATYFSNEQLRSNYIINILDSLKSQLESFHELIYSTLLNDVNINDDTVEVANDMNKKLSLMMKSVNSLGEIATSSSKKMRQTVQSIDIDIVKTLDITLVASPGLKQESSSLDLLPNMPKKIVNKDSKSIYNSSMVNNNNSTNSNNNTNNQQKIRSNNQQNNIISNNKAIKDLDANKSLLEEKVLHNEIIEAEINRRVEIALAVALKSSTTPMKKQLSTRHTANGNDNNNTNSPYDIQFLDISKISSPNPSPNTAMNPSILGSLTVSVSNSNSAINHRTGSPQSNKLMNIDSNMNEFLSSSPSKRLVSSPLDNNCILKAANHSYGTNYTLAEIESKLNKIVEFEAMENQRKIQTEIEIRKRIEQAMTNIQKVTSKDTRMNSMLKNNTMNDQHINSLSRNNRNENIEGFAANISSNNNNPQYTNNNNNHPNHKSSELKKQHHSKQKNKQENDMNIMNELDNETTTITSNNNNNKSSLPKFPSNNSYNIQESEIDGSIDEFNFLHKNSSTIDNDNVDFLINNNIQNDLNDIQMNSLEVGSNSLFLQSNTDLKSNQSLILTKNTNIQANTTVQNHRNKHNMTIKDRKNIKSQTPVKDTHLILGTHQANKSNYHKKTEQHIYDDDVDINDEDSIVSNASNRMIGKDSFEELEYEKQQLLLVSNEQNRISGSGGISRGLPAPTRYDLFNKIYKNVSDMKKYNMIRIQAPDMECRDTGTCTSLDNMFNYNKNNNNNNIDQNHNAIMTSTLGALILGGLTDMTGTLDDLSVDSKDIHNSILQHEHTKENLLLSSLKKNNVNTSSPTQKDYKNMRMLSLEQYELMKEILKSKVIDPHLSNYLIDKFNPNQFSINNRSEYNNIKEKLTSLFDKDIVDILILHLPKPNEKKYSPTKEQLPIYASTESGDFLTRTYKVQDQSTPRFMEEISKSDNPLYSIYDYYQGYLNDIQKARLLNACIINDRISELIPKSHTIHKLIADVLENMINITGICNKMLQLLDSNEEIIKTFIKQIKNNPNALTLIIHSMEIVNVSSNFGEIEAMKISIDLQMIEYRSLYERINTFSLHELENCCKESKDFDYSFKYYLTNQGKLIEITQRLERCKDRIKRYNLFNHLHRANIHSNQQLNINSNMINEDSEFHLNTTVHSYHKNQVILVDQLKNEIDDLKDQLQDITEDYNDQEVEMLEVMKNNDKSPDALLFFAIMHDPAYLQNLQQLTLQMKQIKPFIDGKEHIDFITLRKRLQICVVMIPNIEKLIDKYHIMYKKWSQYRLNWFTERKLNGGSADAFNSCALCFQSLNVIINNNNNHHKHRNKSLNNKDNNTEMKINKIENLKDAGITILSQFSSNNNNNNNKTNKLPILVYDR